MEIDFWKDKSKKQIHPELFSNKAEELAKLISSESNDRTNAPTQIRKFYDEAIRFDGIIKSKPEDFEALLPYIKMLNAKAAYAHGRESGGKPLVSRGFKDFISNSLKKVNDKEDFEVFSSFFEAFMGFYKLSYEENKNMAKQQREQYNKGGRR